MSYIFISYSDKEFDYAQKIVEALVASHLEAWVNWKNKTRGEDWARETYRGIEGADAFLFLLSPGSVVDETCNIEIAHAITTGKRILPIVIQDADVKNFFYENVKVEIARRNWIFCRKEQDNLDRTIIEIINTINTDFDWLKYHTRLQVKAAEWKRNNQEKSLLLRGKELQSAEDQLVKNGTKEPYPTELQQEYVKKSRQIYDRRRKIAAIIAFVGIVSIAIAALIGIGQRNLAVEHELSTQAGELAEQSATLREDNFPVALLLGVEAYKIHADDRTLSLLRANAQENSQLVTYWYGNAKSSFEKIHPVSFSPDGRLLAVQSRDSIFLRDVETGDVIGQPLGKDLISYGGKAFSPNGKIMALANRDNNIVLWDVQSGQPTGQQFRGHSDVITFLVFSPDGKILASAGWDDTVILWDVETGKPIGEPFLGTFDPAQMVFRPDGKIFLFNSVANETVLWDIETGQAVSRSFEEQVPERGLVISPDGNTLVSYTWWEMTFHLWNIDTGQPTGQPLIASSDQSNSVVAFSPDGKMLASAGVDKSIFLWDVESGHMVGQPLRGHTDSYISLVFSPSGRMVVGGGDDVIVFWDLDSDEQPIEELKPRAIIQITCERVGRNFTQAEWQQYLPGEEYRLTCPQWPAGD